MQIPPHFFHFFPESPFRSTFGWVNPIPGALMKTLSCLSFLFGLAFAPLLLQGQERICLGRFPLAGMPLSAPPELGSVLSLESPAAPLRDAEGRTVGYLPALYRHPLSEMWRSGVRLFFQVEQVYARPRAGLFLSVEVWAESPNPALLRPLVYELTIPLGETEETDD